MVFILKSEGKGYKPIATTMSAKEKMRRLKWYLESRTILPPTQMGFRSSRSCIDNLITIINHVRAFFIRGKVTVAAFLDIQSLR